VIRVGAAALPLSALRVLSLLVLAAGGARAQGLKSLRSLRGEESIRAFLAHADQISIVAPQLFVMDSTGAISGTVDPLVIAAARSRGVKLIPLVMSPGFDQPSLHRVLNDPTARAAALLLGLAGYSNWWYSAWDAKNGSRLRGSDIPYTLGCELLATAGVAAVRDSVQDRGFYDSSS
jgi:hypothetical protein